MKKTIHFFLYICLLFSFLYTKAQNLNCANFQVGTYAVCDAFDDNNFSESPAWNGNTADFVVENGLLKTNGPAVTPTTISLYTSATVAEIFEFFVNIKTSTSSGNYATVILMANTSDFLNYNGYFVKLGGTADEISLYRQDGTSNTLLIDGADGVLASSSNNPVKVRVKRSNTGTFTLEYDYNNAGIFTQAGTATDNTYTTSAYFGVQATYSATNNQKYFFDNIYVGNQQPPTLISTEVQSATELLLSFSKNLDNATATNINNYTLNATTKPITATLQAPTQVLLTFANGFLNNNTLEVKNIKDTEGLTIQTTTAEFTFANVLKNEILITEIMTDPDPPVQLPLYEYAEIFNTTNNTISLKNWLIRVGTNTYDFADNAQLLPNEYAIVCKAGDAEAALQGYGKVLPLSGSFGLNNDDGEIALVNQFGTEINRITYTDSWWRGNGKNEGGWSLERINNIFLCNDNTPENWIASADARGGSPAQPNTATTTAFQDLTAPQIQSITVLSDNIIQVVFSKNINLATIQTAFSVNNGVSIQTVTPFTDNTINLTFSSNLQAGTIYTLTANSITDCFGNTINTLLQAMFALPQPALPNDIVFSEILADFEVPEDFPPTLLSQVGTDYIELFNRSNKAIELGGYKLLTESGDKLDTTELANFLLLPNNYVLICPQNKVNVFLQNFDIQNIIPVTTLPSLNNTGEPLYLINAFDQIIASVEYTDDWYLNDPVKKQGGWSLELIDANNPCTQTGNWKASTNANGGTPAAANSVQGTYPDDNNPSLLRAEALDSVTIMLVFDEPLQPNTANNPATFTINNGITTPQQSYTDALNTRKVFLELNSPLQLNTLYEVTVSNTLTDCVGNAVLLQNTANFALPLPALPADIVINEIMPNPATGSSADYVEIYNRSNKTIDLSKWHLATADLNQNPDSLAALENKIIDEQFTIFPKQYLALCEKNNIPKIKNIYGKCGTMPQNTRFLETDLPSLNDTEGVIAITDIFGKNTLDSVYYTSKWHYQLLDNEDGVALERIDFDAPSQNSANWQSAAASYCYGTPGYENSQYYKNTALQTTATLTLQPETFSPNSDGYNDFVQVEYQLANEGYTGNIRIYDERGREVRHLVKSDLMGKNGTYKWDGINETGDPAPIGIYIVRFEAFDLQGNVQKVTKTCVLANPLK